MRRGGSVYMKTKKAVIAALLVCAMLAMPGCFNVKFTEPARPAGMPESAAQPDPANTVAQTASPVATLPPTTVTQAYSEPISTVFSTDSFEYVTDPPDMFELYTDPEPSVTATPKTPDEMSASDLLTYFNNTLNKVKTQNVGFTKTKKTDVLDLQLSNAAANSIVGLVKNALLSSDSETQSVPKGSSGVNVFSPSGKPYVSALTPSDITSITCTKSGDGYVIKLAVKGETNPGPEGSAMSRGFDFITVNDVLTTYAPKVGATVAQQDIRVVFSDCTAELTVNANGDVQHYVTYVKGVMNLLNASIKKVITINTDVAVTLASTTEYTGFTY